MNTLNLCNISDSHNITYKVGKAIYHLVITSLGTQFDNLTETLTNITGHTMEPFLPWMASVAETAITPNCGGRIIRTLKPTAALEFVNQTAGSLFLVNNETCYGVALFKFAGKAARKLSFEKCVMGTIDKGTEPWAFKFFSILMSAKPWGLTDYLRILTLILVTLSTIDFTLFGGRRFIRPGIQLGQDVIDQALATTAAAAAAA